MINKIVTTLILLISTSVIGYSQIIFSENFENVIYPNLPVNWTTSSLDTNGGFYTGNADSASIGGFWLVEDHTSFVMSNDDICLCDESDDFLITPSVDFSSNIGATIFLEFDTWMEDLWQGIATIKIDTGSGWIDVYTIEPVPFWQTRIVNLSQFAGSSNVLVAFHYNDEGTSGLGLAVDNVSIYIPSNQNDAAIYSVSNTYSNYTEIPYSQLSPITLFSTVYNNGVDTLQGLKLIASSAQTGYEDTVFIGTLAPAEYSSFTFTDNWIITTSAANTFGVSFTISHNNTDNFSGNNSKLSVLQVSDSIMAKEGGVLGDIQIPFDGETIAQAFNVFQKDTMTSISLNLSLANTNDSLEFLIYTMQNDIPDSIIYTSEIFTSLSVGWTTYNLINEIELDTGYYALAVRKIGGGITGLSASKNYYVPNTTFTTHFFFVSFFWYIDEQGYAGTSGVHHTYLLRPNFANKLGSVSIKELSNLSSKIYPNPTNGLINIYSEGIIDKVHLYDVTGKLVHEVNSNSNRKQLNLSFLDKGIYFIVINSSKGLKFAKIILQ